MVIYYFLLGFCIGSSIVSAASSWYWWRSAYRSRTAVKRLLAANVRLTEELKHARAGRIADAAEARAAATERFSSLYDVALAARVASQAEDAARGKGGRHAAN